MTKLTNPLRISGQAPKASSPTCPTCGATLHAQAIVTAFNEPSDWTFWGNRGRRWLCHEGVMGKYRWIHFRCVVNGKMNHRVAWIKSDKP